MQSLSFSGVNVDAIQLQIKAAQVDLHAKTNITQNHKAANDVACAQKSLREAADLIKSLKKKLKSSGLTGTSDRLFDSKY
jgi:hypothetical protein